MSKKKKVCILSVADLRHMTCSNFYCEYLEKNKIDFDIICIQRYEEKSNTTYNCNIYQYKSIAPPNASIFSKLKTFISFRKYAKSLINKNKYDFIIVWGENTAWLFSNILRKQGNYCINIRDYLSGINEVFQIPLKKALKSSKLNVVPSPKASNYLNQKHLVMLNKDFQVLRNYSKEKKLYKLENPIVITYMGLITNYQEAFENLLLHFRNDDRFLLRFYGKNADTDLKKFALEHDIKNTEFYGAFSPELTSKILEKTDIINSVYGKTNTGVADAIGVKESYAPLLHIPVLSDEGSFFAEISEKYNFGKGIKIEEGINDIVYEWYININKIEFDYGCNTYTKIVDETNQKIIDVLDDILK